MLMQTSDSGLEEAGAQGVPNADCDTPTQTSSELPQQPVQPPSYYIFVNNLGQTVIPPLPPLPPYAKREDCYYGLGWVIDVEFCKTFWPKYLKRELPVGSEEDSTVDSCIHTVMKSVPILSGHRAIYPWLITIDQPHLDKPMIPPPDPEFEGEVINDNYRLSMCFAFNVNWRTKNVRPSRKQYSRLKKIFEGTDMYQRAAPTIAHLKEVAEYVKRFGVSTKLYINPLNSLKESFYVGGILFSCLYVKKVKDIFAAGGRYDSLIKEQRPKIGGNVNRCPARQGINRTCINARGTRNARRCHGQSARAQ